MIINKTIEKSMLFHPYVYWNDFLSNEEINLIIQYCENKKLNDGSLTAGQKIDKSVRVSKVNFTEPDEENRWIFEKLNTLIDVVNQKFYGFDLVGYNMFQYSTYNSNENGHYDWHVDSHFGEIDPEGFGLHRKLSMTLLLNDDFEGGEFEYNLSKPKNIEIKKGTAIFFPSFVLHRVSPVTKGIRKSLVVWVEGPRWK